MTSKNLPDGIAVTLSTPESTPTSSGVWRFEGFVLDTQRFQLRSGDQVIRIEPQVFDVLTQLVSNHHRFVTKEELFDSVWGGRFVGEAALTSRIKTARRALGDDGESQRSSGPSAAAGTSSSAPSSPTHPLILRRRHPSRPRLGSTSRSAAPPTVSGWPTRWRGTDRRWCARPIG